MWIYSLVTYDRPQALALRSAEGPGQEPEAVPVAAFGAGSGGCGISHRRACVAGVEARAGDEVSRVGVVPAPQDSHTSALNRGLQEF